MTKTKRRQRRINRADYLRYKSRSSLPPAPPEPLRFTGEDWLGLILAGFSLALLAAWALLGGL